MPRPQTSTLLVRTPIEWQHVTISGLMAQGSGSCGGMFEAQAFVERSGAESSRCHSYDKG